MFPITEEYIEREYTIAGNHLMLTSEHTAREIEQKARKVMGMLKRGVKFTPMQPDVMTILEKQYMDTTKRKGTISVTITYICWGLLTVYWNLLAEVNSAYVLAQRVVWSMIFMFGHLTVTGRMGDIRKIFHDKKIVFCCMVSGVLVCINWGVYIFAINSGHVLDASLGYFLEPIFVTGIGVFFFHERMSRLEQMTALFSLIGVGYLIGVYRMVPVMAMVIGLSFAFYGAVKKSVHLDAGLSLFAETLFVTPIALLFCIYSEMNGHGSLGVFHGMQFLLFPIAGVITSVPLLLFNRGVRMIPYYLTGILMYVNPTIQFLMGLFYFHEPLEVHRLIAFCFIWVGVGFTLWHNVKEMKK